MKRFSLLLILLFVCAWSLPAATQTADSWVTVSLKDEQLTVLMPKGRSGTSEFSFELFNVGGRLHTATEDGVEYSVWSLVDKGTAVNDPPGDLTYIDYCADLVWESLLKPRREAIPKESELETRMSYEGELRAISVAPGREYSIKMEGRPGRTRFYVAGRQIYVLIVLNEDANLAAAQRFIHSFGPRQAVLPVAKTLETDPKLMPPAKSLGVGRGGGIGPGEGPGIGPGVGPGLGGNIGGGDRKLDGAESSAGATDYNRVFSGKEVTEKARILAKAEPQYTESARKYGVTGTVVLRAVFSSSGEVTQIKAVSGLPHGLTVRAIAAARNIRFVPAQKDGRPVAMRFQLEYNFNLY